MLNVVTDKIYRLKDECLREIIKELANYQIFREIIRLKEKNSFIEI
jgi:hypothetical protein